MDLKLSYAVCYDVGKVRTNNEDNFYCAGRFRENVDDNAGFFAGTARASRFLAAVCDGMGGEQSGEIASLLAASHLTPGTLEEAPQAALSAIRAANDAICQASLAGSGRMGSTVTALYIDRNAAITCNLGDSRIYRLRGGVLTQLTTDHCKSERLVRMGLLTPEQARSHPSKHELTQHLGIFPEEMLVEPDISQPLPLQRGDTFLLCSDGLTDMVDDAAIARTLASSGSTGKLARSLVQQALSSGGRDNVTVLVIQVGGALLRRLTAYKNGGNYDQSFL